MIIRPHLICTFTIPFLVFPLPLICDDDSCRHRSNVPTHDYNLAFVTMSTSSSNSRCSSSSGRNTPPGPPPASYAIGTSLVAKRHTPSAPFEASYSDVYKADLNAGNAISKLGWCLSHPPHLGTTHPEDTRCFTITQAIRAGEDRGAQILLTNDRLVAKIYDPLHYNFIDHDFDRKIDVVITADRDYSKEAAAYEELRGSPLQGCVMPTYFSSWTLDVPTLVDGKEILREVRMILIEYIEGTCMLNVDARKLTKRARVNVMSKVIEAHMDLFIAGVRHYDLAPRNTILTNPSSLTQPLDLESPDLRAYLIDFNVSTLTRIKFGHRLRRAMHNPLYYWLGGKCTWAESGWMGYDDDETKEWMWNLWGNGEEGKYVVVKQDPAFPLGRPKAPPVSKDDVERRIGTRNEKVVKGKGHNSSIEATNQLAGAMTVACMEHGPRLSDQESRKGVMAHDKDEDKMAEKEPKVCVEDNEQAQDTNQESLSEGTNDVDNVQICESGESVGQEDAEQLNSFQGPRLDSGYASLPA